MTGAKYVPGLLSRAFISSLQMKVSHPPGGLPDKIRVVHMIQLWVIDGTCLGRACTRWQVRMMKVLVRTDECFLQVMVSLSTGDGAQGGGSIGQGWGV